MTLSFSFQFVQHRSTYWRDTCYVLSDLWRFARRKVSRKAEVTSCIPDKRQMRHHGDITWPMLSGVEAEPLLDLFPEVVLLCYFCWYYIGQNQLNSSYRGNFKYNLFVSFRRHYLDVLYTILLTIYSLCASPVLSYSDANNVPSLQRYA